MQSKYKKLNYVKILSAKSECVFLWNFIEKHRKNGKRINTV